MTDTLQPKDIKELIAEKQLEAAVRGISSQKDCQALLTQLKTLEKSCGNELLRDKQIPETWLELHRCRLIAEQKLAEEMNVKPSAAVPEQELSDAVLDSVIRTVLHERLDLDVEESDPSKLTSVLENQQPPADYYEDELEKDEAFQDALDKCTSKDVEKARNRLAYPLNHNNMAYTLKRSNYTVEEVKVQTVGFLGRTLFPILSPSEKYTQSKTPAAKGLGDWIDTPTSFVLARTNDLLQEIKGRLSLCAENKRHEEEASDRRKRFVSKISRFFRFPFKKS